MVLEHFLWRAARCAGDGADAGRGALHQRRAAWQRHHRGAHLAYPIYR